MPLYDRYYTVTPVVIRLRSDVVFRAPPGNRLTAASAVRYTLTPFHEAALRFCTSDCTAVHFCSLQSMRFAGSRWHIGDNLQRLPQTRIDSMEVYESPFHSRMAGELFQSGLRFDDYVPTQMTVPLANYSAS